MRGKQRWGRRGGHRERAKGRDGDGANGAIRHVADFPVPNRERESRAKKRCLFVPLLLPEVQVPRNVGLYECGLRAAMNDNPTFVRATAVRFTASCLSR